MDNSIATLSRQTGLLEATQIIANNIANAATPGYKGESTVFAEYVAAGGKASQSLSMGHLVAHSTDYSGGGLKKTGGTFDLAIQGQGFFKVTTPGGERLTRAGAFMLDAEGLLTDVNGNAVVDEGGSPVEIPPDAVNVAVASDGTISIDGEIFAAIGVFQPVGEPVRAGNNHWVAPEGDRAVDEPRIHQGFIEASNVEPVAEFAELILAQRLFEAGQTLSEQEHDRLSSLVNAIRSQG
jgi:flagellar basal-body rod protein FlgF